MTLSFMFHCKRGHVVLHSPHIEQKLAKSGFEKSPYFSDQNLSIDGLRFYKPENYLFRNSMLWNRVSNELVTADDCTMQAYKPLKHGQYAERLPPHGWAIVEQINMNTKDKDGLFLYIW